ncbi:hypothetical protein M404DRAFT_139561 [Pisolithus tinctorius Marx 270]|uniref:DASH complex subunit DAD2 n=1 Tax=Pisolithus tinctorius Marx 270 TaxID=870435 RepID=A0A0C3NZ95_PISTI|nr:hypothetical protein M404DRAFT_139561 [Pisolithus tinctorius Marx 270]
MRHSVAPSRMSQAASQVTNAVAMTRLLEKKKEYDAVAALERVTTLFVNRIEGLADDCEVMADAGQVHGQVLEQWQNMFRILDLFLANRQQHGVDDSAVVESAPGERLVRIPLDELQVDATNPSRGAQ